MILKTTNDWQAAWVSNDPRVEPFHTATGWAWKPGIPDAKVSGLSAEAIAEWKKFLAPHVSEARLLDGLDALGDADALAVVTGQQAGLALGPLYTVYKALAAKYWAAEIEKETGRRCVPIFWVASDDHDVHEIESMSWLGKAGEFCTHTNLHTPRDYVSPASLVEVPENAGGLLASLAETTAESAFKDDLLAALEEAFRVGTYESQFVSLFCKWLLPLGIFPVVPRLKFIRSAAQPILKRELDAFAETNRSVQSGGSGIKALGVEPPLHRSGNELNFFVDMDGVRAKLVAIGNHFEARLPDESRRHLHTFSKDELAKLIDQQAWRFSPNAILRPLVQDAAFPTVAYIGGSSELLYHGQIGSLYAQFGVHRPVVFPRPNVALLDPRAEKALSKLGVDQSQVASFSQEAVTHVVTEAAASGSELDEIKKQVDEIAALSEKLDEQLRTMTNDTGVVKASERLKSTVEQGREKLLERVEFFLSTRSGDRSAARDRLLQTLFPNRLLQERVLSALAPFLVQNGPLAIERLSRAIQYDHDGMQIICTSSLRD